MKIGVYVQTKYSLQTYSSESFSVRLFAGVGIIADELKKHGKDVSYCGVATVNKYDIILISITAAIDWYSFIQERIKWPKGDYKVIVGGAGVLNVRPFLEHFDYAVFGRGEDVINDLVDNIDGFEHESVCKASDFSTKKRYKVAQATRLLGPLLIGDNTRKKQTFQEFGLGCKRKCLFCCYSWQRKYNSEINKSYQEGHTAEFTMLDLDFKDTSWARKLRLIGVDGMSQRLRYMVNKRISKDLLLNFMKTITRFGSGGECKLFCVVGLPTENDSDMAEMMDCFKQADQGRAGKKRGRFLMMCSPFIAMPVTPAAWWPMAYKNLRGARSFSAKVKDKSLKGNVFFNGKNLWGVEGMGTSSLQRVMTEAIVSRGTEKDSEAINMLCNTPKFWNASASIKEKTLEKYFDMASLFKAYEFEELPTRYLETYIDSEVMYKMGQDSLKKHGE